MGWHAQLKLDYRRDGEHTLAHDQHEGPLRVLQRLYPEGPGVCHHVVLHPPGGVVGGDELHLQATLTEGSHALITTPGATRFYRSEGQRALQSVRLHVHRGARLEWLPMETLAYSGCLAHSRVHMDLAPGAEMMGWDVLALGLPAAQQPFVQGRFSQQIELRGVWLEKGVIAAADDTLLHSAVGMAGHGVLATLWFAAGQALGQREALLDAARQVVGGDALTRCAGVTSPQPSVVVLRVLAQRVEPAMALLVRVRAAWRQVAWQLADHRPRIWST